MLLQASYDAIMSFKSGTAPVPSGLRAEHLKEAKGRGEGRGAAALGSLTRLVNCIAAGNVSQVVAPFLFGANLFAVIKKSGGYRPVAVGDILRRLTSKVIMREVTGPAAIWGGSKMRMRGGGPRQQGHHQQ